MIDNFSLFHVDDMACKCSNKMLQNIIVNTMTHDTNLYEISFIS
jgi:hypothetical protein